MKKYLCLILIAITVFLSGCNYSGEKTVLNTESESQSLDYKYSETLQDNDRIPIDHDGGEVPLPTFSDISEYNKFISKAELPEDFVYYEDIKELGTFDNLVILSEIREDGFSKYSYKLKDKNMSVFYLKINRQPPKTSNCTDLITADVDASDMLTLDSEKSGKYKHENLEYQFLSGKLYYVFWESNDLYYMLVFESHFHKSFDPNSDSYITKIFNIDTANEVVQYISSPKK